MLEFVNFPIFIFLLSLIFDIIFGEIFSIIHPVVHIGKISNFYINYLINFKNKYSGLILSILTCLTYFIIPFILFYFNNFILYIYLLTSLFSFNLLLTSANNVKNSNNINEARNKVSYLVSRDTNNLNKKEIISATIETLSENITDSFISPIFYFFIVILLTNNIKIAILITIIYRIFNTLDAMIGYKNEKYCNIGYFPAKMDDILNFIPSRIAGLFVVFSAFLLNYNYKNSFKIMIRDCKKCPSPNSGYTMASCAGALNIQLIKKGVYILGDNNKLLEINDISKAIKLSALTMIIFTIILLIITFINLIYIGGL